MGGGEGRGGGEEEVVECCPFFVFRACCHEQKEKFDEGKETIKTACHINFKKVYNAKTQKLAIRGNFEEEMTRTF